ncbi:MAG: CRISPR-associated helicase Cas3' [Desulfitobacterium hafniense]|nr:CRISPR-associated helicase Cas3' [Desulfitobacterium hafniense]
MNELDVRLRIKDIWAKSPIPGERKGLNLLEHTEQVLNQMEEYLELYGTQLAEIEGFSPARVLRYAAIFHDLGKCHAGFQSQLRKGEAFRLRHEILSLAFLGYLDIPELEFQYLAAAIALHHKNWQVLKDGTSKSPIYYDKDCNLEDLKSLKRLVEGIESKDLDLITYIVTNLSRFFENFITKEQDLYPAQTFPLDFRQQIYKALSVISELIGSMEIKGSRGTPAVVNQKAIVNGVLIRGLIMNADRLASVKPLKLEKGFSSALDVESLISQTELWKHQKDIKETKGSAILIAPTGFGKSEASLLWAGTQRATFNTRGRVFFLLPYRASMNAMALRFEKYFGINSTSIVHGKSLIRSLEKLMEEEVTAQEAVNEAKIKESVARLNATPYRICSPYQLIRAFFGDRSSEAVLSSALGGQFIVDEIHAYDLNITALTISILSYLEKFFSAKILFMSATMPTHLLNIIQEVFTNIQGPVKICDEILSKTRRHQLILEETHVFAEKILKDIIVSAQDKSVLVVVNQISRAIKLYQTLSDKGVNNLVLLHSRFTARDRQFKEKLLNPMKGQILIATQVVEVSLDVDYDIGFFELAPLESLIQRLGRINRKGRQNSPAQVKLLLGFEGEKESEFLPYNQAHLLNVKKVLVDYVAEHPSGILSESMIQKLLDKSYSDEMKEAFYKEIRTKISDFQRFFVDEYRPWGPKGKGNIDNIRKEWDKLFESVEVIPKMCTEELNGEAIPLEVARLLVPISINQFNRLKSKGKIAYNSELNEYEIDVPYDLELGLQI